MTDKPNTSKVTPRVRPATLADKEAWVTTIVEGYDNDEQFQWRYPKRKEFPEDARTATGNVFENIFHDPKTFRFVAELPEDKGEWKIAAIAIWEWRDWDVHDDATLPSAFSSPNSGRRDMNIARQKQFIEAIAVAERKYFSKGYGSRQLELASFVTHPNYYRRGAGSALMKWGIDTATEQNVPIILTASPAGMKLYERFGFKVLGPVDCEVEAENGNKVYIQAMIRLPERWTTPKQDE